MKTQPSLQIQNQDNTEVPNKMLQVNCYFLCTTRQHDFSGTFRGKHKQQLFFSPQRLSKKKKSKSKTAEQNCDLKTRSEIFNSFYPKQKETKKQAQRKN